MSRAQFVSSMLIASLLDCFYLSRRFLPSLLGHLLLREAPAQTTTHAIHEGPYESRNKRPYLASSVLSLISDIGPDVQGNEPNGGLRIHYSRGT
jgi:hypothetical protein